MDKTVCSFCDRVCQFKNIHLQKDEAGRQNICYECYKKTGIDDFTKIAKMTYTDVLPLISGYDKAIAQNDDFRGSRYIPGVIEIDDKNKFWRIAKVELAHASPVFGFEDIRYTEVCENGVIIAKEGAAPTFFGSMNTRRGLFDKNRRSNELKLIIHTSLDFAKTVEIIFISSPTEYRSSEYKNACERLCMTREWINKMKSVSAPRERVDDDGEDENDISIFKDQRR